MRADRGRHAAEAPAAVRDLHAVLERDRALRPHPALSPAPSRPRPLAGAPVGVSTRTLPVQPAARPRVVAPIAPPADDDLPARGPWLRRALLAGIALAVAAVMVAAPSLGAEPAPTHVAVERAVDSTVLATGQHTYELLQHAAPSMPVQWLACRPIEYRINPAGEPAGLTPVIRRVMADIGAQTGVTFTYAGATTHTFDSTWFSRTDPTLYFSFTDASTTAGQHFAWPGEVGVGGPAAAWLRTGSSTFEAITYGRVLLYTGFHGAGTGAGATWQSLITHEVGHALDLDHRTSTADAMYPSLTAASPGRFSPAEVKALRAVLQRQGCDYRAFARL
ncbi:hypothetical protein QDR37_03705 [Amnibacterium sp. CER49]|uniref:hypothetical protein n=1 Tax=Amnibacterium sp. CER49 TaxID=3039161 RepID=UPI002447C965|nr:hypothetical protein [Amnibacterium sp. CER49]MDH2443046.1 hypothetical protein [Amnibacterium sp. CER49]